MYQYDIKIVRGESELDIDFGLIQWFTVTTRNPEWEFNARADKYLVREYAVTTSNVVIDGDYMEPLDTNDDMELEQIEERLQNIFKKLVDTCESHPV